MTAPKKEERLKFISKYKGMAFTSNRNRVPYVANVPIEQEQRLNEQASQEVTWISEKNRKARQAFDNLSGNLRKVADYLSQYFSSHFMESLSYKEVAEKLGLKESVVRQIICELAGWSNYPLVIIKTPKKKGYFQLNSKNWEDTDKWITFQSRSIASRQERLDKTVNASFLKRKQKKKVRKVIQNANPRS